MAVGAGAWLGVMLSSPLVPTGDSELISQTEEMVVVTKERSFFCWYLTCHPSLLSYITGRMVYACLDAHDHSEELTNWSRWHLAIMNGVAGLWSVTHWVVGPRNVILPSLIVGAVLVSTTLMDVWNTRLGNLRGGTLGSTQDLNQSKQSTRFD
jgi:hypothetical protein